MMCDLLVLHGLDRRGHAFPLSLDAGVHYQATVQPQRPGTLSHLPLTLARVIPSPPLISPVLQENRHVRDKERRK